MFQTRSFAVAAVAISDIHPYQRDQDFQQLLGAHQHAKVTGESFVAGGAP
jgi:hypothetical protein